MFWPIAVMVAVLLLGWFPPAQPVQFATAIAVLMILTATAGTILTRRTREHVG